MQIKYIHLRYPVSSPRLSGDYVSPSSKGGLTVAYCYDEESKQVDFAVAKCCKRDNFNKRLGRTIACNRLLSPKKHTSFSVQVDEPNNVVGEILRALPFVLPQEAESDLIKMI